MIVPSSNVQLFLRQPWTDLGAAISADRMLSDLSYVVGPIVLGIVTDLLGADAALGGTA